MNPSCSIVNCHIASLSLIPPNQRVYLSGLPLFKEFLKVQPLEEQNKGISIPAVHTHIYKQVWTKGLFKNLVMLFWPSSDFPLQLSVMLWITPSPIVTLCDALDYSPHQQPILAKHCKIKKYLQEKYNY